MCECDNKKGHSTTQLGQVQGQAKSDADYGNEWETRVRDNDRECFNEWAAVCVCVYVCMYGCVNLCLCVRNIGPRGSCNCRLRSDRALK